MKDQIESASHFLALHRSEVHPTCPATCWCWVVANLLDVLAVREAKEIACLADIRKAIGDEEGRLMQDELVDVVRWLADAAGLTFEELRAKCTP